MTRKLENTGQGINVSPLERVKELMDEGLYERSAKAHTLTEEEFGWCSIYQNWIPAGNRRSRDLHKLSDEKLDFMIEEAEKRFHTQKDRFLQDLKVIST